MRVAKRQSTALCGADIANPGGLRANRAIGRTMQYIRLPGSSNRPMFMTPPATALPVEAPQAFLGVARSLTDKLWRDRLDARGAAKALAIVQRHQLPELLARVLAGRGVDSDAVADFLDPTIRKLLPDPFTVTEMEAAAKRIADAAGNGEKVAIFGDYDVDGATSAALLTWHLRHCGLDPLIHIPDRIFEGYGPNTEAVRALAEKGATLLVTVDCGTTSIEPLAEAKRLGMSVVVIDHHQAGTELPEVDALVNPNRLDDLSGLGHLAAVGLVLVTLVAVNRELRQRGFWNAEMPEPDLLGMLHHVALGTVADVAPLIGLNRAFVAKGLIAMRRRDHVGHTALMDVARLNGPPEAWHLGFMLGPRINAGGRIGRADLGVRLLLEGDSVEAARIAAELDRLNSERRIIEQAAEAQAEAEALASIGLEDKIGVIVTASEGWHPGVVGLVASRLKEKFSRPAFAIALEPGGIGTGSGRSIAGVDLGKAVRQAVADGILLKGGGHAMAAGVTLRKEKLAEFRAYLEDALARDVAEARHVNELYIDGAVSARAVTTELATTLNRAGPFGSGNPEVVLALPAHQLVYADEVGQAHLRLRFKSGDGAIVNGIAFRSIGQKLGNALVANRGQQLHVAGSLSVDRYQGAERVQFRVIDVALPDQGPSMIR
ncbi:SinglestrandedDNAspecific exonuclease RecJ EC 31 [Bradyrhizobium sp.]|nr:SinglestrandedDNAspecific exonuclease RecJ EC 31 [Bradyrhizobium sp.]